MLTSERTLNGLSSRLRLSSVQRPQYFSELSMRVAHRPQVLYIGDKDDKIEAVLP